MLNIQGKAAKHDEPLVGSVFEQMCEAGGCAWCRCTGRSLNWTYYMKCNVPRVTNRYVDTEIQVDTNGCTNQKKAASLLI